MVTKSNILALLEQHQTSFSEELDYLGRVIDFVLRNDDCWQRSNLAGHLTGSAWVLSPNGESALLIHHKKLDRWLQPGGHVDETDDSLAETALREASEECSLDRLELVSPNVFDVDVHKIPERSHEPAHFHYDLRFVFKAKSADFDANLLEVKDIRWVPLLDLIGEGTDQSIRRMAMKSLGC